MLPFQKILCPVDFSESSVHALRLAAQIAEKFDAQLCAFHVVPFLPVYPDAIALAVLPNDEMMDAARRHLDDLLEREVSFAVRAHKTVTMGEPAGEILRLADDEGFDLIVMATHGRTGWRHLVFGSVAEAVLRAARCPVLSLSARAIPADEGAAHDERPVPMEAVAA